MKVEEKIALNFYRLSDRPHIVPDKDKCTKCRTKPCLYVCPAGLYTLVEETGEVKVEVSGCLECGSCLKACPEALDWSPPDGRYGIQYRYG